jgi:hypothetical protein
MRATATSDSEPLESVPVRHSPIISFAKLAEVLDNPRSSNPNDRWDARRVRRLFKAAGIGARFPPRGHHYTTYQELRDKLPLVADLYAARVHEDDVDHL